MIHIAFCFDENMVEAAGVAIASLLNHKKSEEQYVIHCICSAGAMLRKNCLTNIAAIRDEKCKLKFYPAPEHFNNSYEVRGISTSTYLRLTLHRILPELNQVIYSDVDVLFCGSLGEIWKTQIGDNLLAGVKGANNFKKTWEIYEKQTYSEQLDGLAGKYINAGILLMNLKKIREWNPDELWSQMSQQKYHYQDQDILNITCKGKIVFWGLENNVAAHLVKREFMIYAEEGIYTAEECEKAWLNPVVLHYTGEKPWKNRGVHKATVWWRYVDSQADLRNLFEKRKIKYRKNTGLIGKINRHLPW